MISLGNDEANEETETKPSFDNFFTRDEKATLLEKSQETSLIDQFKQKF